MAPLLLVRTCGRDFWRAFLIGCITAGRVVPDDVPPSTQRRAAFAAWCFALSVAIGLVASQWRVPEVRALAAMAGTTVTIAVGAGLYRAWRARRNARLVLEWERRLDSNGRR